VLPVCGLLAAATALAIFIEASPTAFWRPRSGATVLTIHTPAVNSSINPALDAGIGDALQADAADPISYFRGRPALWQYRWLIVAVIVVGAQMVLIAALLSQRRQLRRVGKVLLSREATLRASYSRTRELTGALIHAQETARIALAQDLHDDICQDIVGIAMSIDMIAQSSGRMQDPKNQYALAKLHQGILDVAGHVRLISHELHPATLQLLGLAPAVKAHCLEVEARYHAQVVLHTTGDMTNIHPTTALCLFRVAQESMRNAAAHGEARHIDVSVTRFGDDIELAVRDDGRGFDVESTRRDNRGLGLVSMEERVHTAGGEVMIWSKPGGGTTVLACVPAGAQASTEEDMADGAITAPYDGEAAAAPSLSRST
jgi:signal transduction histidine kinase